MRPSFLIFCTVFLLACKSEPKEPFVAFTFAGEAKHLSGFSDTESSFYTHNWPEDFTSEYVAELNAENPNVLCGRLTSTDKREMLEIHITWPKGQAVEVSRVNGLLNDTVWTLNTDPGRANYDEEIHEFIAPYLRITWAQLNAGNEFLSDSDPSGYLVVQQVEKNEGGNYRLSGVFDCSVHGIDAQQYRLIQGKFHLDFYVGL